MNKGYSLQDVQRYIRRYGEMRFGKPIGSSSEKLSYITLPEGTPEGLSFSFSTDEKTNLYLNAPSGLCCDWGVLDASPGSQADKNGEYKFRLDRTCFIYDRNRSFLLGVDPKRFEIWKLPNHETLGASIKVEKLSRTFKNKDGGISGIEDMTFSIRPAEFVGIYGGSGTGKTVLIERILSPEYHALGFVAGVWQRIKGCVWRFFQKKSNRLKGSILIDGKLPEMMVDNIAYLPQSISLPEELTCKEIFELAAADRGVDKKDFDKSVTHVLDWCVLDETILHKKCKSLSGGQKRRVALAVALLRKKTTLLIVDEPTTGLDIISELEIMHTLRTISRRGITVVAVTHSIASCRLFDRVLMLKKTSPQRGSTLAFNGLWHEEVLKQFHGMSDTEIFGRCIEPDETEASSPDEVNMIWPYDIWKERDKATGKKSRTFGLKSVIHLIFCPLIIAWKKTRQIGRQGYHWVAKSTLLNIRNFKRIIYFSLLAALCTIIVQLATEPATLEGQIRLITLLSLAAPWLCATYAALFVADSTRFFAWEKFSGLKTPSFVLGTLFSMLLPVALISLVFTCGMFWSVNNKALSRNTMSGFYDYATKHPNAWIVVKAKSWLGKPKAEAKENLGKALKEKEMELSKKQGEKEKLRNSKTETRAGKKDLDDGIKKIETEIKKINKGLAGIEQFEKRRAHITTSVRDYKDSLDGIQKGEISEPNNYPVIIQPMNMLWDVMKRPGCDDFSIRTHQTVNGSLFINVCKVWLSMMIICMCGVSIGIVVVSRVRDLPVSILAIVVLFIFFLSFSRLMITYQKALLGPWSSFIGKIPDSCNINDLFNGNSVPILFSFASLGRYATNSVVYSGWEGMFEGWRWSADKVIILFWSLFNVLLAIFGFSRKKKNWKAISR